MTRHILRLAGSSAAAVMLAAAPALAGSDMAEWDTNADAGIDRHEFEARLSEENSFRDYDLNDDDVLDMNEFGQLGVDDDRFGKWDLNEDTRLDQKEFWDGAFGYYDEDESDAIEASEFGRMNEELSTGAM